MDLSVSPVDLSVRVDLRDLQTSDLDLLGWSGGPVHLEQLRQRLDVTWRGEGAVVVAELASGVLVGVGVVDWARMPPVGWLSHLSVRESWQGLGLGTALIRHLESAAADAGCTSVRLAVESDNPRAAALYRRLGYRQVDSIVEVWPTDRGVDRVCVSAVMARDLPGRVTSR